MRILCQAETGLLAFKLADAHRARMRTSLYDRAAMLYLTACPLTFTSIQAC